MGLGEASVCCMLKEHNIKPYVLRVGSRFAQIILKPFILLALSCAYPNFNIACCLC